MSTIAHSLATEATDAGRANREEGLIFRRGSAGYAPGRRSDDLLKDKFLKEADVVVTAVNAGKESVEVSVRDGSGRLRPVGNVSTIGKGDIEVGQVVEATFLYVHDTDEPTMVQPRITRVRDDKSADECSIDQFAHAGKRSLAGEDGADDDGES